MPPPHWIHYKTPHTLVETVLDKHLKGDLAPPPPPPGSATDYNNASYCLLLYLNMHKITHASNEMIIRFTCIIFYTFCEIMMYHCHVISKSWYILIITKRNNRVVVKLHYKLNTYLLQKHGILLYWEIVMHTLRYSLFSLYSPSDLWQTNPFWFWQLSTFHFPTLPDGDVTIVTHWSYNVRVEII